MKSSQPLADLHRSLLTAAALLFLFLSQHHGASAAFTTLATFNGSNGSKPYAALVQGTNGMFYGTTSAGGDYGRGSVFAVTTNGVLSTLFSFDGSNGAQPQAGLLLTADGSLFGTTAAGGDYGKGTVFMVTLSGGQRTLLSLDGTNGAQPTATIVLARNGSLYGTASSGGAAELGTVFKLSPKGSFLTAMSLGGTNGSIPAGGLLLGTDGTLYGTASAGGTLYNTGTIFRVTTNDQVSVFYSFADAVNGAGPQAGLTAGRDGNFYGTTAGGGDDTLGNGGNGTVFRISRTGTFSRIVSFSGTNGMNPFGTVVQGPDYMLYGTTVAGGDRNRGTVFSLTTNGVLTVLHAFTGGADGSAPYAGLIRGIDGNYYGTTSSGGRNGHGTIFKLGGFSPFISVQPAGQTVQVGSNINLSISAEGSAPFSYQWQRNAENLTDGGNLSGTKTPVLTIRAATTGNSGTYSVAVKNAFGTLVSSNVTVTVVDPYGTARPTVSLESPSPARIVETPLITLTGKAGGPTAISRVYYRLNDLDWQLASAVSGYSKWTASVELTAGTNVVEAYAVNLTGTPSLTNAWVFTLIPNPFISAVGSYSGLFVSTDAISQDASGAVSLKTTRTGKFTGTFWIGGKRFSGSGQFDTNGDTRVTVNRPGLSPVAFDLSLDLMNGSGILTGNASDGNWTAPLVGGIADIATVAFPGKYTFLIQGVKDGSAVPGGDSYGTVTVSATGKARLTGVLADGTKISQSVPVLRDGFCPVYLPLYKGMGSLLMQLQFGTSAADAFTGNTAWIKPADPKSKVYPEGFSIAGLVESSVYIPPAKDQRVIDTPTIDVILSDGILSTALISPAELTPENRVIDLSGNRLSLAFSTSSGQFKGRVVNPNDGSKLSFGGVVLQSQNVGHGFFIAGGRSGLVTIQSP